MKKNKFDGLLSLADAAEKFGKAETTLRNLINLGRFEIGVEVKKFGKQWVFDEDALERYYNKLNSRQGD